MFRQIFIALIALTSIGASRAAADLQHTTTYRDHRVRGTTARELWQYMIAHPIIDPDDGPAYANITHDHSLTFQTAMDGGACKVRDLSFTWNFIITLPKAANYAGMSTATAKSWQQFSAYLKAHEERHQAIFLDCGKSFVPAAEKMTSALGCAGLDRKVRAFVDRQYALCMTKQRDFDRSQRPIVDGLPLIRAAREARIPIGGGM